MTLFSLSANNKTFKAFNTNCTNVKKTYGDVGIAELQKETKKGRGDGIKQYTTPSYIIIFPHNTCIMRKICGGLHTELFYAIPLPCFISFCSSAIPTSPHIFNVVLHLFTSFL